MENKNVNIKDWLILCRDHPERDVTGYTTQQPHVLCSVSAYVPLCHFTPLYISDKAKSLSISFGWKVLSSCSNIYIWNWYWNGGKRFLMGTISIWHEWQFNLMIIWWKRTNSSLTPTPTPTFGVFPSVIHSPLTYFSAQLSSAQVQIMMMTLLKIVS